MQSAKQHQRADPRASAPDITMAKRAGLSGRENLGRPLREQIDRAARVQRSLLPDVSGSVGGYRLASAYHPCEALGGDFYDIFHHPDSVTLMVSDVMGHGAEAALLTMILKAVFHETAPAIGDPGALLTEMNERLRELIPPGTYAATTVARLDPATSEVRLANAGQPYPFVLRASQQRVDEIVVCGVPLGLFQTADSDPYPVRQVRLAPDDVLLIASDGIGSIEDDTGQCFEDRCLRRALTSLTGFAGERVIDSLVAEAVDFSNGLPFPDDINLIAVSRDGRLQRN